MKKHLKDKHTIRAHTLVVALALAFAAAQSARANTVFMSSRPNVVNSQQQQAPLPPQVPAGAIVLMGGSAADAMNLESRTRACQDIYGVPSSPLMSYSGGPWTEIRMNLAYGQYTAWTKTAGECTRNYYQTRSVPYSCPTNQTGTHIQYQQRYWSLNDADETTSDTGWTTYSTTYTCNYYYLRTDTFYQTIHQNFPCLDYYQSRSYQVWSDGSIRSDTGWVTYNTVFCGGGGCSNDPTDGWGMCWTCCFPAGCLVLMADGSLKAVEDVQIGDWVMGSLGRPAPIVDMLKPVLGPHRRMLAFDDGSLLWSEEHAMWVRDRATGQEWAWSANRDMWLAEMREDIGPGKKYATGLKDIESIWGKPANEIEFASVDGFVRRDVVEVQNWDENTPLYSPSTGDGQNIIVNGYAVGAVWDEAKVDYSQFRWEEAAARIRANPAVPGNLVEQGREAVREILAKRSTRTWRMAA